MTTADGLRVGELARATGLTVRALHHYEDLGLLTPARTLSGHRRYHQVDVERLYRISVLRQFGLSLAQVRHALDDPAWSLRDAMTRQVRELERRLVSAERLRQALRDALQLLDDAGRPETGPADSRATTVALLEVLQSMTVLETAATRRTAVLVYADIEAAYRHLVDVLGLAPGSIETDATGTAVHAEVRAGDGVVWLHRVAPEWGLASPRTTGAATAMLAVTVDDVDAHHARVQAAGGDVVYPPIDQPYGVREFAVRGPEGELWSFMTPLE